MFSDLVVHPLVSVSFSSRFFWYTTGSGSSNGA
jgi:hypothetical protein